MVNIFHGRICFHSKDKTNFEAFNSLSMKTYLIKNARIVNEGKIFEGDVLIEDTFIAKIGSDISHENAQVIDAKGHFLLPLLADQEHPSWA